MARNYFRTDNAYFVDETDHDCDGCTRTLAHLQDQCKDHATEPYEVIVARTGREADEYIKLHGLTPVEVVWVEDSEGRRHYVPLVPHKVRQALQRLAGVDVEG